MKTDTELFEQSLTLVPGGVHSPVRSFKGLHRTPIFFTKADGAYIYDGENNSYIDFCMSFGPLILGHKNPEVQEQLKEALSRGWSFGACEPYSLELAQFLIDKIPHIEQLRFVNSGTEAVMTALRIARGYTNKPKIIKFNGCYHGHTDSMLIKAGSGLAGTAETSSAGVPTNISDDTLILELGDLQGLKDIFTREGDLIAAVIIEPLPANNGLLPQTKSFLKNIRELTTKHNTLLIFDEVISGFRTSFQGMTGKTGIIPDITTYGKIIGGGLPVGAIASTKEIMSCLAPIGNVYQAGTLSANPLAMVAGLETLKKLNEKAYSNLESYSKKICDLFDEWFQSYDNGTFSKFKTRRQDSLFWIAPNEDISNASSIPKDLVSKFKPLFKVLLEKGIYLSPNAYEVGFVSLAHNEEVIQNLKERLWK